MDISLLDGVMGNSISVSSNPRLLTGEGTGEFFMLSCKMSVKGEVA